MAIVLFVFAAIAFGLAAALILRRAPDPPTLREQEEWAARQLYGRRPS